MEAGSQAHKELGKGQPDKSTIGYKSYEVRMSWAYLRNSKMARVAGAACKEHLVGVQRVSLWQATVGLRLHSKDSQSTQGAAGYDLGARRLSLEPWREGPGHRGPWGRSQKEDGLGICFEGKAIRTYLDIYYITNCCHKALA